MVEFRVALFGNRSFGYKKRKFHVIHDQLRELCLRKAREENFLYNVTKHELHAPVNLNCQRRIVMSIPPISGLPRREGYMFFCSMLSASLFRSLIVCDYKEFPWVLECPAFKLLRVFYATNRIEVSYEEYMLKLVNLRCILSDIEDGGKLDSTVCSFRNLQMLVSRAFDEDIVPSQFWNLPHLRHVQFGGKLKPWGCQQEQESVILENLGALFGLKDFRFDEAILKRIPNVKKLKVTYGSECGEWSQYSAGNIPLLEKLECLDLSFEAAPKHDELVQNLGFPDSLKKLTLKGCELDWEDMSMIGMLPNLEVLTLNEQSFTGGEWNPIDGQFLRLKRLNLHALNRESPANLISWNVESNHFPVLKELILSCMEHLEEIPSEIGQITTLELIILNACSESLTMSAKNILLEDQSYGNYDLLVHVFTITIPAPDDCRIQNFIVRHIFE